MKKTILAVILTPFVIGAQTKKPQTSAASETKQADKITEAVINSVKFRSIGPAVTSGRVVDLAINPDNPSEWYVAAGSGGVWKTDNAGTTFYPVFENQGSYSIGCIKLDPRNSNVVWVGSGENNNQRSVGFGDGVYQSEDGGKTWKNMGLSNSEHIGMIAIDPRDSKVIFVAAYGPLWSSGGDRGLYKSTDGGKTWKNVLNVSENTGINEVHINPDNPNEMFATAHQRRRHEWTYLGGGPESAIYKSTDNGNTWVKLGNGLPSGDLGRISLAIPPTKTDYVYAMIESAGIYFSKDRGASWVKQSGHYTSGNYYVEIFPDPVNPDKIYSMNTWAEVSKDAGKSFTGLGEKSKHVDNHVIWVDPKDTRHLLVGCDGGLYESWDAASTWDYKSNLPITQFYRVCTDNAEPFYHVYGGTQDNNTLGGPARTQSASGIHNYDWFVTVGGDGFKSVTDPLDPDIVYSQWQYGGLIRFNRKTGEAIDIKPMESKGEPAYRFNWDAPIVISSHDHKTLYFAAQKVFRSKDMGNSWEVISPDLSSGIDRNKLPVMGKVWSIDAVAKNQSTSIYGNITAFSESVKNPQLLAAGTDDGCMHITKDGGKAWKRVSAFVKAPAGTLIQNLYLSLHDENTIFAVVNNHRNGDFKPYLLKSSDLGATWVDINGNLPQRGPVQCFAEDPDNAQVYYCGTEFGMYVSIDAGKNWHKMNGLPTIGIREIVFQKQQKDIVVATFGRGIYVVDDYTQIAALAKGGKAAFEQRPVYILSGEDGYVFNESTPLGHRGKSFQGERFFVTPNPENGVWIQFYSRDEYKTIKDIRTGKEKDQLNDYYPARDTIRLESLEKAPYLVLVITDLDGQPVRTIKEPATKGMHRVVWDGRMDLTSAINFYTPDPDNPYESEEKGPMALPGKYQVQVYLVKNNERTVLSDAATINIKPLYPFQIDPAFNKELSEFRRVVQGVVNYTGIFKDKLAYLERGEHLLRSTEQISKIAKIRACLDSINIALNGDGLIASKEFEVLPGLSGSLESIVGNLWATSAAPTGTYIKKLRELKDQFGEIYNQVVRLDAMMKDLEKDLDQQGFPYTPGRLPVWTK